jgi:hypothetical protein
MSKKKPIEFTRPPKHIGGDAISVSVRFNYLDGSTWRGGLTIHAETQQELKKKLSEAYEDKKPREDIKNMVAGLKNTTEMDLEE